MDGALHALATLNAGTDSFVQAQSGMTSAHHSLINQTKKHKENVTARYVPRGSSLRVSRLLDVWMSYPTSKAHFFNAAPSFRVCVPLISSLCSPAIRPFVSVTSESSDFLKMNKFISILCAMFIAGASAFVPPTQKAFFVASPRSTLSFTAPLERQLPAALQRQRKSMASVQTMGLFGLGAPEIAIILIAAAFLLGPQKLAELGKDAGKIAGELKEVPKEFQKGLAEGEQKAAEIKKEISEAEKEDKQ